MEKETIYRLLRRNDNPSLKGNYYPRTYSIKHRQVVSHEGRQQIIRLVEGARSVILEDQLQQFGDLRVNKRNITFRRGVLRVPESDYLLRQFMDFLENDPKYKHVFERIDADAIRENEAIMLDLEERAMERWIEMKGSIEECKSYLRAKGVKGLDDMEVEEIKHKVRLDSRKNPKAFLALANSKERKVLADVNKAIEQGLIELRKRSWFDISGTEPEKVTGFQIGAGEPMDLFVEWLTSEGKDYYEGLKKRIK
jgi:hypothetical protein